MCALLMAGYPLVQGPLQALGWPALADALADLSLYSHFNAISRGVLDLRDMAYFILTIAFWLTACVIVLDTKRGV